MKTCGNTWCNASFEVSEEDRALLEKSEMPEPMLCSDCRHQRRAAFQIALSLYERKSALSGKPIVTIYHPAKPYAVYSNDEWWGDAWDPLEYGREADFSRPFFEQVAELYEAVPKMAAFNEGCENCEYCASAGQAKNCYYCRTAHRSENCYYCEMVTGYNENLCDCLRCQRSQWLYECIQCIQCAYGAYLYRCSEVRDSYFCTDCRGCSNCIFCHNLRNKECYVRNKSVSKEEFQKEKERVLDGRYTTMQKNLKEYADVYGQTIWKDLNNVNCENCIGDGLANCTNCYQCFHCFNAVNCRYCWMMTPSEQCIDAMDITRGGIGELLYSCTGLGGGNYFMRMCCQCRKCSDMTYCIDCFHSKNCFGCVGLKRHEYCILNKRYTKEEYEALVQKMTDHMKKTPLRSPSGSYEGQAGEWGQFFPPSMAPFPYNDSLGQAYFPLAKEEAVKRGFQWEDPVPPKHHGDIRTEPLPESIEDVTDAICNEIITCEETKRKFKFIPQEIAFYKKMKLPLPRTHPDIRMAGRSSMLTPHTLWKRTCMKCGKEIQTSYPPEQKEIVYCEECYLKEVY